MKTRLLIVPSLILLFTASLIAADFYVFSRIGGGTMVGCKNKVKGAMSLEDAAKKRSLGKFCGAPLKKTSSYIYYDCKKLQSKMWVVKGKSNCMQYKTIVAKGMKSSEKLYAFFSKKKKYWGACSKVIGFEGLKGVKSALGKSCGKPIKTDNRSYVIFHCKNHGNRNEFYFNNQRKCMAVLKKLNKRR